MSPTDAGAVHLDVLVSHLSTSKQVKEEIDAITRTISLATFAGAGFAANLDPRLLVRLGELKARLPQIERRGGPKASRGRTTRRRGCRFTRRQGAGC
jgi:hypothetical protein